VEVETTGKHVNRAADRGCCVSSCVCPACDRLSLELKEDNIDEMKNRNQLLYPRRFKPSPVKVSRQPEASLAWPSVTEVVKRRQRVLKPWKLASKSCYCLKPLVCWVQGQYPEDRQGEIRGFGRGLNPWQRHGRGYPGTCEVLVTAVEKHRMRTTRSTNVLACCGGFAAAGNRKQKPTTESPSEIISEGITAQGSRSILIVPMRTGNLAHRDPKEERGMS
jgi:hypothetical protein